MNFTKTPWTKMSSYTPSLPKFKFVTREKLNNLVITPCLHFLFATFSEKNHDTPVSTNIKYIRYLPIFVMLRPLIRLIDGQGFRREANQLLQRFSIAFERPVDSLSLEQFLLQSQYVIVFIIALFVQLRNNILQFYDTFFVLSDNNQNLRRAMGMMNQMKKLLVRKLWASFKAADENQS